MSAPSPLHRFGKYLREDGRLLLGALAFALAAIVVNVIVHRLRITL